MLQPRIGTERRFPKRRFKFGNSNGVPIEGVIPGPVAGTLMFPLTRGEFVTIDEEDWPLVRELKWHCSGTHCGKLYAQHRRGKAGVTIIMHRLILGVEKGTFVDHIDGNGLNNRRCNLRIATVSQNNANRDFKRTQSQFRGVRKLSNTSWYAVATKNRVQHRSKPFRAEVDAAREYDRMARELHGEFAVLNFPDESGV